jgi:hypothetical protein
MPTDRQMNRHAAEQEERAALATLRAQLDQLAARPQLDDGDREAALAAVARFAEAVRGVLEHGPDPATAARDASAAADQMARRQAGPAARGDTMR